MARALNRTRIRDSWIITIIAVTIIFVTKPVSPVAAPEHEVLDTLGLLLIIACAMGRVYASAFLGGFKNNALITYGPYSVVRNPLYVFSLLGVLGISIVSMHLLVVAFAFPAFVVLYYFLIRREEKYLLERFGDAYADYMKKVPRLIPNPRLYNCPETIEMKPKFLNNAVLDAVWWLIAFQLIEIVEPFL
jgi:protein-S-isoprenylcysteine O-methyltransferase Ste14